MRIDHTAFGDITIDGKTYEHDVIIRLSGEVAKRKKKLSKRLYGTSHIVSKDEAKFVFEKGCRRLILGSGQEGNVRLSPGGRGLLCQEGLPGRDSADTAGDSRLQQSTWEEDRPVPRDLLRFRARRGLRARPFPDPISSSRRAQAGCWR